MRGAVGCVNIWPGDAVSAEGAAGDRCRHVPPVRRAPRRVGSAVVAAAGVLLLVGCTQTATGALVAPLTDDGTPPATGSGSGTSPAVTDGSALPGFSARTVAFGQFDLVVEKAVVSRQAPGNFADPTATPAPADTSYLHLQVKAVNRLKYSGYTLDLNSLWLALGNGQPIPAQLGQGPLGDQVQAGGQAEGWLGFALPSGAVLGSPRLLLGTSGYQEDAVPLTGSLPAPAFPRDVALGNGTLKFGTSDGGLVHYELRITSARLANSVAFDWQGASTTLDRPLTGRRLLWLQFSLTADYPSTYSLSLAGLSRLEEGHELTADAPVASSEVKVGGGVTGHGYLVWDVPAGGSATLVWGQGNGLQLRTAVPAS